MRNLIQKFKRDTRGAIAVETAIVTPILMFILLPALDLGMQVHATQKMNKATDSGVEYLVNGGRSESTLRNIVQASFGDNIAQSDLNIDAYCGCVIEDSSSSAGQNGGGDEDDDDNEGRQADPYASSYVRTSTNITEDMCSTACSGGMQPAALVELSLNHNVTGAWKDKSLNTKLQTRIK